MSKKKLIRDAVHGDIEMGPLEVELMDTPEFQAYLKDGALKPAWLTGPELTAWMEKEDKVHHDLMEKGGLLKK